MSFYFYYITFTLLLLRSAPYPDNNGTTTGQPEQHRDHSGTTSAGQPKQQRDTSGTTAGQPRDNLGTPRERTSQAHTHIVFPQLLSLHDLADSNFNLCSTLSASGQPLTPVSMPAPPRMLSAAAGVTRPSGDGARQSLSHEISLWQRRLVEKESLTSEAQRADGIKTTSKYLAAFPRQTILYR